MVALAEIDPYLPLPTTAPTVRAEGVSFSYGEGDSRNQVLFGNGLEIAPGQLVVMTGPSGSGKTTLLTLIGALRSLQEGRIELLGNELSALPPRELVKVRRDIGFIFQLHNLFEALTAYENVKMALQLGEDCSAAVMRERGVAMLERLGLGHRINYKPHSLSGGQRQRVAIARALILRPGILVCDEPTSALDVSVQAQILNLLLDLKAEFGLSYLFISHDLGVVEHLADRVAVMYRGSIVEQKSREAIFSNPEHPYTQMLLSSVLTPEPGLGLPELAPL